MSFKKELIQRAADLLKRFHPETPIVALTDPEHGDVDDLSITAGELQGVMEAFARSTFTIEANPASDDDIAKLMDAAKLAGAEVRGSIFPAPTVIQWLLDDERGPPEPDFWTSHNNMENLGLGKGVAHNKGDLVWDFALQTWTNADTPLYTAPPRTASSESTEVLRIALKRISELTPASANARDARDMHLTVKAIADVALEAERNGSASSSSGTGGGE